MEYMFMPLKRYAEFSGRSRRMEYWSWFLFQLLLGFAFGALMGVVGGAAMMTGGGPGALVAAGGSVIILFMIFGLVWLALVIPGIAVAVRRLHDTNRTGWWLLAPFCFYVLVWIGVVTAAASPNAPAAGGLLGLIGGIGALVMFVVLLVFLFLDGTPGPNRFGPDPKARASEEVFT